MSNISNKQTCSAAISSAPISRGRIPDLLFVSGVVDDCLFQLTDNSFDWKKKRQCKRISIICCFTEGYRIFENLVLSLSGVVLPDMKLSHILEISIKGNN